jgi:plasmid stabilization system protein ParE
VRFIVLPEAEGDAIAAAVWYEDQKPGLADEFLAEIGAAFEMVRQNSQSASLLEYYSGHHEIRRRLLHRFPYAVVYLCRGEETIVVAITHARRQPLHWLGRISR